VGGGGSREPGESVGVPALVVSAEQIRWISRRLAAGERVVLDLDVATTFHDDDPMAYNTVAEIRGGDLRQELVMAGAHLDSWHAATGSTDNAAGVAVVMEAVRILQAVGAKPRRTIRVALWTGEEQGLLGSRAYVREHFAARPEPEDPGLRKLPLSLWPETWPIQYRPGWDRLSAYFNLDNGSGRIRGVYTQGNLGVVPIFERWLLPFRDLGADTVTNRSTGGSDHLPFDGVGLPGFQFVQDALDYSTRTHHTHLDHYDHASVADLKQASVILASFLYHAAMRDQKLPRKPRPQPTDAAATVTDGL
jgi:Zn-dependent M28 family amino/carboxypeptidase